MQDVKIPFKLEGGDRIDDTLVHKALREALANCLINADYYGRQGVVVIKRKDSFLFSNPGDFRIDVEAPKIEESYEPERITLSLQIEKSSDKSSDNDKKATLKSQLQKETIIEYLTEKVAATTKEIAVLLGVKEARARRVLSGLIEDNIVLAEGANRNRVYRLK